MKKRMALGIVLLLILSVGVIALEGDSAGTTDYSEMNEQEQINYLQENHGITIGGAGLSGVIVSGDSVSISDGSFDFKGATFSGGSVEIVGNEIVSADGVLINDYNHNGAKVFGTVTIGSGFIHLDEGTLNLGSSTDSGMEISASAGTNIDVSGGSGYSGNIIANDGKFDLKLRDSSSFKEQHLGVGLDIELVNGRIKKGEDLEALILLEDALDAAPGETASFAPGTKIENGEIESEMACVGKSCSDSSGSGKKHTVKVIPVEGRKGNAKLEYSGENIKHSEIVEVKAKNDWEEDTERVVVKRELVQTEGSVYDPETQSWELAAGTRVKELKPFGELVDFSVSKKTDYFPNADSRTICDASSGSCFAIDKGNAIRIKSKEGNEIKVETEQTIPHLIVDKIDDGGEVSFRKYYSNKKGKIDLLFQSDQAMIAPLSGIEKLDMQIAFGYEKVNGKTRAMRLDPLGYRVQINGETITHFDEEVAKNYYLTKFGSSISLKDKQRYLKDIKMLKIEFSSLDITDPEIIDLFLTARATGEKDLARIGKILDTYGYLKDFEDEIDSDLLIRSLIQEGRQGGRTETLENLLNNFVGITKTSPLFNMKLMKMYEDGLLSKSGSVALTASLRFINFEDVEDANRYLDLVSEVSGSKQDIIKVVNKASDYAALYKQGIIKTPFSTIDLLEKVMRNEEFQVGIPPELGMNEKEFFDSMASLRIVMGGGYYRGHYTNERLLLLKNSPDLVKLANDLSKRVKRDTNNNYDSDMTLLLKDKSTRAETIEMLDIFSKELSNPSVDKETQENIKETFRDLCQNELGPVLNDLKHDGNKNEVMTALRLVDDEVIRSVLAQQPDGNVGQDHGIYRSNLVLIEKELLKRAKKEGKSFFDHLVSNIDSKKERHQIYRMLAATGIGQTHLAKASPEIIEEYSRFVVEDIILEPSGAGHFVVASESLLKDKKVNKKYQEILLNEYQKLSQNNKNVDFNGDGIIDERDEKFREEKKVVLEALVLRNKNRFDNTNPLAVAIITNPDPKAVKVVDSFRIPPGTYKKWPKDEDGTPIRITIYSHGNTDYDSAERGHFNRAKNMYKGAKVVKTIKNGDGRIVGYELQRDSVQFDGDEGKIKVRDKILIFAAAEYEDYEREMEKYTEMSRNGQVFMKAYGGHIGGEGTDQTLQGEPTLVYYNGCYSASTVEGAIKNGNIGKSAFTIATPGTGTGASKGIITGEIFKMLEETDDMVAVGESYQRILGNSNIQDADQYTLPHQSKISGIMEEEGRSIEYRFHQYNEPENNVADTDPETVPPADLDELEDHIVGILTG